MNFKGVIGLALLLLGAFILIDLVQGHGDKLITLFSSGVSTVQATPILNSGTSSTPITNRKNK